MFLFIGKPSSSQADSSFKADVDPCRSAFARVHAWPPDELREVFTANERPYVARTSKGIQGVQAFRYFKVC